MKEKKTKNQCIDALVELLNALRKEKNVQDMLVQRFQELFFKEGLFSRTIREFPYPIVVFQPDGVIVAVSNTLTEETGLCISQSTAKKHNILNRITDPNFQILDAVEDVFSGKCSFLTKLNDPLAMFLQESSSKQVDLETYQSAVFFPIAEDENRVAHGAVIFMK